MRYKIARAPSIGDSNSTRTTPSIPDAKWFVQRYGNEPVAAKVNACDMPVVVDMIGFPGLPVLGIEGVEPGASG